MTTTTTTDPDIALKARHRAMWALGDYPTLAHELIEPLGLDLVRTAGIAPAQRVLDVAAGAGNAALPAARAGADVTAADLTPELLAAGRARAEQEGVALDWREADVERLPFADASFDVVMSCVGAMFAPHHQATADAMLRVVRPGGTVALLSWTPGGFIGQMFATMKPFQVPPPAGVQSPPLWGDEQHVRSLFGDRVTGTTAERRTLLVDHFAHAEEFRDYFKARYGPTIAAYRGIADDPERTAELDAALADLGRRYDQGGGTMEWEYLLLTTRKAG